MINDFDQPSHKLNSPIFLPQEIIKQCHQAMTLGWVTVALRTLVESFLQHQLEDLARVVDTIAHYKTTTIFLHLKPNYKITNKTNFIELTIVMDKVSYGYIIQRSSCNTFVSKISTYCILFVSVTGFSK